MKIKFTVFFVLSFCLLQATKAQQQVQFSQYIFNMLNLNPAYAGYRGGTSLNAIHRRQWTGIKGAPITTAISADWLTNAKDDRLALSAGFMMDEMGAQKTLSGNIGVSYRIPLGADGEKRLCFGINGGFMQFQMDGTVLEYVDENDQRIPVGKPTHTEPDATFGVYYYTPKYYITASVNNLLQSTGMKAYDYNGQFFTSIVREPHLYVGAGAVFNVAENLKLKPSFLWKEDFKGPSNIDVNAFLLIHDILWLGASYRTGFKLWDKTNLQKDLEKQDAVAAMLEVYATKWLRVGYAYDFTTSGLNNYQSGTHEISVSLFFPNKRKREISPRYF
ncbi:type IX secretion system PorP/SprF family membrane protein [Chitinophaga skermanii]|uniref:Type IX secretion system PorP/SprF family membrane protein n=1 Tax=Chitinophaga skermanii TaxID=331697 RepID=A0A327Q0I4_9BACT|nr:type IX secretion system membrane protein PorP/SprF [Chitinophaga skermanii]RAI97553.1 type IX secretion system PorP/SprF family membrane protein [Chitinophaga skermanii]